VILAARPSLTLTAVVNGFKLPVHIYTTAGEHVYQEKIPGAVLREQLEITFQTDDVLRPPPPDTRALGVFVPFDGWFPLMIAWIGSVPKIEWFSTLDDSARGQLPWSLDGGPANKSGFRSRKTNMRRHLLFLGLLAARNLQSQTPPSPQPPFTAKEAELGKQLNATSLELFCWTIITGISPAEPLPWNKRPERRWWLDSPKLHIWSTAARFPAEFLPPVPGAGGTPAGQGVAGVNQHPRVKVDRALFEGDVIKVGPLTVTAYLAPGHSPSSTSWLYTVRDGGKNYRVFEFCCWEYPHDIRPE
jgi:hypothetical protein